MRQGRTRVWGEPWGGKALGLGKPWGGSASGWRYTWARDRRGLNALLNHTRHPTPMRSPQGSPHQGVPLPKASSTQSSLLIRPVDLRPHCYSRQPTYHIQPTKHPPVAAYKPQHITVFCCMPLPHGRRDSSCKIAQSRAAVDMHGKSTHATAAKKLNPLIVRIVEWCSEAIHTVLNRFGTKG